MLEKSKPDCLMFLRSGKKKSLIQHQHTAEGRLGFPTLPLTLEIKTTESGLAKHEAKT